MQVSKFFFTSTVLILASLSSISLMAAVEKTDQNLAAASKEKVQKSEKENRRQRERPKEESESPEAEEKAPAKESVKFHVVKADTFVEEVKLAGHFESTLQSPIEIDLKRWTDMTVIRVLPHGSAVKAGEVLIELETKDLKKKIEELRFELPVKELEFVAAEQELEVAEKSTPLSLEKARREKMEAEQDLAHFEDESRPMKERAAREDVKEVVESLAYAEEELKQLKKMYEQDDLTEETEEIILRRTENTVTRYRWMLEQTEARSARMLDTLLPREHESLKSSLELQQINWRNGEKTMRDALEKKRLSTAAKKRELEELRLSLAEHEEDLASMKVIAPHDGIVYYGMCQRGKWPTAAAVEKKLIPGGKLAEREIVMTVVNPSKLQAMLVLSEEELKDLEIGQK